MIARIFIIVLALLGLCSIASAATIYIPDNYAKIQWAVDNASAGDTIIVRDGTYTENINVNKPHLTIRSENGSANCIIDGSGSRKVFYVTADHVSIIGFTVENATEGIYLYCVDHCNIWRCERKAFII